MKYWCLLFFLSLKTISVFSQNGQGYFHDYTNSFYVFDKGIERKAEPYPVSNIFSGNDYVAYTDSKLSFVYYYNGNQQILEEFFPNKVVCFTPTTGMRTFV